MKLIKLLEGLYQELKIFNEKYPEYLSEIVHENKMLQKKFASETENFKFWFDRQTEELKWEIKKYNANEVRKDAVHLHGVERPQSARARIPKTSTPLEFQWIRSQLLLKNIRLIDIAKKAKRDPSTLTNFLCGKTISKNLQTVIASELGYTSWDSLWADAVANSKGSL